MLRQQGRRQAAVDVLCEDPAAHTPMAPAETDRFENWLARVGLLQFLEQFEESGYDDLDELAGLDTPEAVAKMMEERNSDAPSSNKEVKRRKCDPDLHTDEH